MPERPLNWLAENYPWLLTLLSIFGVGIRNEVTTQRLKKSVYSNEGDLRLVKVLDCNECRLQCQAGVKESMARIDLKLDRLIDMHLEAHKK